MLCHRRNNLEILARKTSVPLPRKQDHIETSQETCKREAIGKVDQTAEVEAGVPFPSGRSLPAHIHRPGERETHRILLRHGVVEPQTQIIFQLWALVYGLEIEKRS